MKYDVARPSRIVDINRLSIEGKEINDTVAGGLRIGDLAGRTETSHGTPKCEAPNLSSRVRSLRRRFAQPGKHARRPAVNLLPRTRCYYFYDNSSIATKVYRLGFGAIGGVNRINAILGSSDACIAVHPSDMCVALAALAPNEVEVRGPKGKASYVRLVSRLPDQTPEQIIRCELGELITAVVLLRRFRGRSTPTSSPRPVVLASR